MRYLKLADKELENALSSTLTSLASSFERGASERWSKSADIEAEDVPVSVSFHDGPTPETFSIEAKARTGRALWHYLLGNALREGGQVRKLLRGHRWTVLCPPEQISWITSDDPVVLLNYYGPGKYDFEGRVGRKGTEILLPLDSKNLLYTQVGNRRPGTKYTTIQTHHAVVMQRILAEHAYRLVIANKPREEVEKWRPRRVDADAFATEKEFWQRWPEEESRAEIELLQAREQSRVEWRRLVAEAQEPAGLIPSGLDSEVAGTESRKSDHHSE